MEFQSCCIINNQKNTGLTCNGELKRDVYVCMIEVSSFCVCFHAFLEIIFLQNSFVFVSYINCNNGAIIYHTFNSVQRFYNTQYLQ